MSKRLDYLKQKDGKLAGIIDELGTGVRLSRRGPHFEVLCRSIVGQQLSTKVARTIFGRLQELSDISPEGIGSLKPERMRGTGLSGRKVEYLQDLAHKFLSGHVSEERLKKLDDEEVVKLLTEIRGIGQWTAEMFLIFSLRRPDVFSVGDLGLRRAMEKLYGNGKQLPEKELIKIASRWSPHRSVVCLYLWKWYDGVEGI